MDLITDKLAASITNTGAPQRGFEELGYIFDIRPDDQQDYSKFKHITNHCSIGAAFGLHR